jgi:KDO2-lipid IV(A) lauroyltransferase
MPVFRWYYIIFSIPIYLIALIPRPFLYWFSDFLRFLFYHVIGYRKTVIFENLRNSFPEKEEHWIKDTGYAYYQNMIDVILETIEMAVLPKSFYAKNLQVEGREVFEPFRTTGRPTILVCGHQGNWEWAGQRLHQSGIQVDVLYHPLSSEWFNWFMYFIRARHGIYPIPMANTLRDMLARKAIPTATTFIADQSPSSEGCHWMAFLNQDTPVFLGAEKLAKKFNYPVVFGDILRLKRGKYKIRFYLVTANPKDTDQFWITEKHTDMLENSIKEQPETWLWSHRRWKHKRNLNHA